MKTPSISEFHGCLLFPHLQFSFCLYDFIDGFCVNESTLFVSISIFRVVLFSICLKANICGGFRTNFAALFYLVFVGLLPTDDTDVLCESVCVRICGGEISYKYLSTYCRMSTSSVYSIMSYSNGIIYSLVEFDVNRRR